jgi:uncharacterized protein YutE (UPF0331/DUF86 family)
VVLRPDAVRERLLELEEVISNLESTAPLDATALRNDFRNAWTAERGLQLGAEAILDVGNHILSAHFGVAAKDYEDIITQLAARGVIDEALRENLKGLGGFRNVLVQGYLRIDPVRVAEHLAKAPALFSDFARQVRTWMGKAVAAL